MSDSYDWVLLGLAVTAVTVTSSGLWVWFNKWRQNHRARRSRQREFL